jgi:hypothetical protein
VPAGQVEGAHGGQGRAAPADLRAAGVRQPSPQRLDQAGPAVGAGAAPDPEDDPAAAGVQRCPNHLSGAVARCRAGGQAPAGEPPEPRHVGQLDHGDAVALGVGGVHRLARRPLGPHRDPAVAGRQGRLKGPVAAVGHRHLDDLDAGGGPGQAGRHPGGDLRRGQRALELVRRDDDTHLDRR